MAVYRRVHDSRHLQADCQEPGSAPEPYALQSSIGYLYTFTVHFHIILLHCICITDEIYKEPLYICARLFQAPGRADQKRR